MYVVLCGTQEVCEKGRGAHRGKASFGLALLALTAIDLTHPLTAVLRGPRLIPDNSPEGALCLGLGLPPLPPNCTAPGCGSGTGSGCQVQASPALGSPRGSPRPPACPDKARQTRQGPERWFYFSAVLAPSPQLWSVSDAQEKGYNQKKKGN